LGREVEFNPRQHPHIDHGYAVTSHSSQGATTDRVLLHVNLDQGHRSLVNSRLAYVGISRAQHDVQFYTNDASQLAQRLGLEVSKTAVFDHSLHNSTQRGTMHNSEINR
jgi:ATP-dependent exoDNAse (exonuclease V) alpha subunit